MPLLLLPIMFWGFLFAGVVLERMEKSEAAVYAGIWIALLLADLFFGKLYLYLGGTGILDIYLLFRVIGLDARWPPVLPPPRGPRL